MILYAMDVAGQSAATAIHRFYENFAGDAPMDAPEPWAAESIRRAVFRMPGDDREARAYAEELAEGVEVHKGDLDGLIRSISRHWRLDRMAVVDRNLLRLAAYELVHRSEDVPRKVAINEAIELAKRFGATESGAFVNGILDRIEK